MFKSTLLSPILVLAAASFVCADAITLVNTIPSGDLVLQPPILTGGGDAFGAGTAGTVLADGFTVPIGATLDQISVVVGYDYLPGITGTSPMLLTLLADSGDSPGKPIESWTVPLDPTDSSLAIVTVDSISQPLLLAGEQYWLSVVPTDPIGTGIGWGLASPGYPGIQLPIAFSSAGVNGGWQPTESNLANEFSVTGTATPEAATFGISALAFIAMIAGLRSRRRTPEVR